MVLFNPMVDSQAVPLNTYNAHWLPDCDDHLQREVSQFRVAVRHLFTKSLEVAQLQDASVLDESRSIVSPSRLGAPSPARDGWM